MKRFSLLLLLIIAILGTYSCKDDPEPAPAPTISSISPTKGTVNTEVTISGLNFAATASANTVKFNAVVAEVVSASPTQIVAKVPSGASTGKVTVETTSGAAEGPEFEYLEPPTITSIAPLTGPFSTSVTIAGTRFETDPLLNTVKFNGVEAVITSVTTTQLVVTVPVGAGTGKVTVTTSAGTVVGSDFTYVLSVVVTTFAGDGTEGFADGPALSAKFFHPSGLALDAQENVIVADRENNRIRKITPDGMVTTLAGSGEVGSADGNGTSAKIRRPAGVYGNGTTIYFTEGLSSRIGTISSNADVITIAGTTFTGYVDGAIADALFAAPSGVVKDSQGNLFVADFFNNVIRKIATNDIVSTFAGDGTEGAEDGPGLTARFYQPWGITIDASDNLYVTDLRNNRIRKITSSGVVTTIAGGDSGNADGVAASAKFNMPYGLAFDKEGNLLISDSENGTIRKLSADGNVSTIAGNGTKGTVINGVGAAAQFSRLFGMVINSKGEIFVSDYDNAVIRKIVYQ